MLTNTHTTMCRHSAYYHTHYVDEPNNVCNFIYTTAYYTHGIQYKNKNKLIREYALPAHQTIPSLATYISVKSPMQVSCTVWPHIVGVSLCSTTLHAVN